MKNLITALLTCLISISGFTQTKQDTKRVEIEILKEFYVAYNTAWSTTHGDVLIKKLDSLKSKYCTIALRRELKKEFKEVGLDHDEIINDQETNIAHLKTLIVASVPNKRNVYIVSYMAPIMDGNNNPVEQKVSIRVTLVSENGNLRISRVEGITP